MGLEDTLQSVTFTLARFCGFAANALLFGVVPILGLVVRPVFASLPGDDWVEGRRRLAARVEGLVQAGLAGSILATGVVIATQAVVVAQLHEGDFGLGTLRSIFESSFGQWYLVRIPLVASMALLLIGQVRRWALTFQNARSVIVWWVLWALLSGALLATSTFSGHAAVASPRIVSLVNDLLHLAAGATWFAGIVVLAIALPDGWTGHRGVKRLEVLSPAILRFSRVAMVSLTIVAITGTINSFLHVHAVRDLIDSGYGRTLTIKIGLFLVILALGGINHFFIRDRLEEARLRGEPASAQRTIRKTVALELAVALLLMTMTGLLVGLARTRPAVGPPPSEASAATVP